MHHFPHIKFCHANGKRIPLPLVHNVTHRAITESVATAKRLATERRAIVQAVFVRTKGHNEIIAAFNKQGDRL